RGGTQRRDDLGAADQTVPPSASAATSAGSTVPAGPRQTMSAAATPLGPGFTSTTVAPTPRASNGGPPAAPMAPARPPPPGPSPDPLLRQTAPEVLQQTNRPADARGGQAFDRARREAPLKLAGAEQHLNATAGEGDANAPIILGIGRRFHQAFGLEPLHECGGCRA